MTIEILTDYERADLLRLLRSILGGEPPEASLDEFEAIYIDGRTAGLCHEGALELVRDAAAPPVPGEAGGAA